MTHFHKPARFISRRSVLGAGAAGAALILVGCGGSDGDDAAADGAGNVASRSFASGPIRGFGSIVVANVHYDETAALISNDGGASLTRADLRLGMVVDVAGSDVVTDTAGHRSATASSIDVRSELEGPISAMDATQRIVTVLDQQVQITDATVFDDDLAQGFDSLSVGQVVEIYGWLSSDGHYRATRIDDEDDTPRRYKLRGPIRQLDAGAHTFRIGNARISYAGLAADTAQLADGQYARVELDVTPAADRTWRATRIQVVAGAIATPTETGGGVPAEIEGYITDFTSSARFSVSGVAVDASGVRQLPVGLMAGVRVEVKGVLADGLLTATRVERDDDDDDDEIEIKGSITALDAAARILTVQGVRVDYSRARFKGGTPAQLALGVRVEIEGRLAADGSTVQAFEVEFEREHEDGVIEITDRITSLDPAAQTFVLRGITVDYARARFKDGSAAQLALGLRVEVEGRLADDGATLLASKVEFEDDDDEVELEGRITSVDATGQTFVLRDITVDYASARFEDGSAAQLAAGVRVEVKGQLAPDGRALVARKVEFDD